MLCISDYESYREFFDWSALKMTNCQTLKEILTLKTFSMGFTMCIYYASVYDSY